MKATCHCHCRDLKPMDLSTDAKPWIHVAQVGEFPGVIEIPAGYDVPGFGVVAENLSTDGTTVITDANLERMIQDFDPDVLIDYEHFSHDDDKSTEAAGWGLEVRRTADRLGMEMQSDWAVPAREKITQNVYRYVSPEYSGTVQYEGGVFKFYPTSLTGAGLTNRPKITALRPVSANRQTKPTDTMSNIKSLALLCSLLGVPETTPEAELESKATAFAADLATSKNRATQLETEVKVLRDEAIERYLETFAEVIEDKAAAKELLQLNRAATVKTFAAQLAKKSGGAQPPLYQKNRATAPDGSKLLDTADEDAKEAQRTALVATVKNREKCDFTVAWNIAKAEKPELF